MAHAGYSYTLYRIIDKKIIDGPVDRVLFLFVQTILQFLSMDHHGISLPLHPFLVKSLGTPFQNLSRSNVRGLRSHLRSRWIN